MNKPASLRAALAAAVPSLVGDPDRLLVFIDQGYVVATAAPSLSYEYRYVLNVIVLDYAGDADAVFVPVLAWVKRHQPDLLANADERKHGITFEADHLTQTTCDLSIKLRLTESVVVSTGADGRQAFEHVDEPVYEWDVDALMFGK
jgi:hypothetical protein